MCNRYLLHVGFPKTASTWLQNYLQQSQKINYIGKHVGGPRWCSEEVKSIRSSLQGLIEPYTTEQVNKIIENNLEVDPKLPFVLSDEILAKPWKNNPNWVIEYAQLLNLYFPGAQILLTVRKQSDIACSLYRKHVEKFGIQSMSMRQWFEEGAGSQDINFWNRWNFLDYYEGLSRYFTENITVIPYEMMKVDTEQYCSIITDFFGIDDIVLRSDVTVNEVNFKTNSTKIIKMLFKPYLWNKIKREIKTKPDYDQDLISEINEQFCENNNKLADLVDVELQKYGYY